MAIESVPALGSAPFFGDTFAGIAPQSAAIFILVQLTAATLVTLSHRLLAPSNRAE